MGIPVFYRWLVDRYPKCVVKAVEDRPVFVNGVRVPVDVIGRNPNGIEYDNLYLDMNGIIHPCFHPEGLPAPTTYDKVFEAMFKYIDKIFSIVRPRKLLFMAIDGVAPRAKMNQQRARRFKAAKEAAEAADGTTLESEEEKPAPLEQPEIDSNVMDSNVITPGTEFMELLSAALRYYIHSRMNEDSGWKGIKVILSDATVAGEGEHKIMSYIRLQRNLPGYDPNTWHCMYGLDADLIMLALATHEINFSILREDGRLNKQNRKYGRKLINQIRKRGALEDMPKPSELLDSYIMKLKFQFLNIWVLREYLKHDMEISDPAVKGDLERFVDDFVFLCLFVGNDFLPQIPSLEISEGAINLLLMIYKDEFVKRGGYLTNSFEVNLEHVEHFLHSIGAFEQKIIGQRTRAKNYQSKKRKRPSKSFKLGCNGSRFLADELETKSGNICSSAKTIKTPIMGDKENPSFRCTSSGRNIIIKKIKLHALDWKERFYVEKFEAKTIDDCERIKKDAAFKYVEGICWVMRYYYQEVCSWQWFYPYHYAPFASDFVNIDQLEIQFTLGEPFKPLDQLLGVLPAASAHALPMAYRKLMTDSSSPMLDFYPTDFEVDMEGKRFAWQAVIKLPFIEESRLLFEIAKVEHTLTDEDRKRNTPGLDVLFVHRSHPLAAEINSICQQVMDTSKLTDSEIKQKIDPALSGGMNGYIYISDKPVWPMEIYSPIANLKMIAQNDVISVLYKYPSFHSHIPRLPDGVMLPEKIVGKDDLRPLSTIWCSKDAHLLYARKTQAICSIMNSRRNKPKTNFGSCKRQVVQCNEAGYTLRRQLVVNRCTKDNANIVLNCHVKKLKNCDLQKWRKGDGESIPEDALLRLKENKSSERDQVPCEDNNGNCAEGLKEADREVKHGKVEGVSFRVEKFERYVGEQTDGGGAKKTRDAVEYRNRKLRSKKQKHSDDVTCSNGRKICNFENIEQIKSDGNNGPVADGLEEKMVEIKHSELNGVLCNKRRSEGINAKKTEVGLHADLKNDEVEYNSRGELERGQTKNEGGQPGGFIKWEQTEVDKSRDGMEMETEVRSNKKKKPRSRKRKHSADIVQINDENLKRFCVKEPIENDGGDGVHKDAFKMENSINREQHEEVGLHAAPAGIGDVKTEVKSKKNRKRSREKKYSNSEALSCNNDLEFQSCSNKEQCTVGGHNTVASGVGVLKGVTKSSNLTEGEVLANESSVILGISVFPNQDNKDGDNASVCAFQETRTEVESAADGMKQKTNLEPSNDAMMLSSIRTEHSDGTSSHAAADGLLVKNSEAQPLKRRQKPRLKLKKAKLMEGFSSGKLEGSVSQNLNNKDGNDASVCASQETRTEVESADDGMKQKTNLEPSNDAKMLSSIQPEHDEGTSGHTAADRLLVKNSKAQPLRRRQKRRLKKSKLKEVGPLANDSSGKLEGPALLSLNNKDGDNAGVCAFRETRTEAESGVEGMKQKTNLEPSNDAELLSSFQIERSEGISGHAAADGLLVKNSEAQPLIGRKRQGLTSRQRLRLKKQKLMEGEKHRFKEKGMKKDDIDERSLPTSSSPGREKRQPSGYKVKKEVSNSDQWSN